jgi:triphosphoribosyl-dephospho-CoA synthase
MPELSPIFHRHDLLLLKPDAEIIGNDPDKNVIRVWLSAGWPVIVCRPGTTAAGIHCGIPLPPELGKKRITFAVNRTAVNQKLELPRLTECLSRLPESRRNVLSWMPYLEPEVFGSLAWQHLTGLPYLHEHSDIDLLFRVSNLPELRRLMTQLRQLESECCDIEIMLWNNRAFSWREFCNDSPSVMVKTDHNVFLQPKRFLTATEPDAEIIVAAAIEAIHEELETYPKPGLVSYVDSGSHVDMDVKHFLNSIRTLPDYFQSIVEAGKRGAPMEELRQLGINAEQKMLAATSGVNTHRGAIFSLGLLAAAAGYKATSGHRTGLGEIVRELWGKEIMALSNPGSHGTQVAHRYGGNGGAKAEATNGFRSVYEYGLPTFRTVMNRNAARIHSFFSMLEHAEDTTLLYRGGAAGRDFAVAAAVDFNHRGGVNASGWADRALRIHHEFVKRNLSCGGVADLLAATVFIHRMEELWQD